MHKASYTFIMVLLLNWSSQAYSALDKTQMEVWANEAIITTYTFDYKNFVQRQKEIAKYFTAEGWKAYSDALLKSDLFKTVEKNNYSVSAVATLPPVVKQMDPKNWQAEMPILVLYKNPQYQQKQDLMVTITFTQAPSGEGVRGVAITSLQSKGASPPCECKP